MKLKLIRIEKSASVRAPASHFVGDVYRQRLTAGLSEQLAAGVVYFKDGAHSKPHVHDGDQLLIITEGKGTVATETEEMELTAGDVVFIPGFVRHSHGAQRGHSMTQIAITAGKFPPES